MSNVEEVVDVRMTCWSCPSQWEGKTRDGRHVYIRYRWGTLSLGIDADATQAVLGRPKFEAFVGEDSWDGTMDSETMMRHLAPYISIVGPISDEAGL